MYLRGESKVIFSINTVQKKNNLIVHNGVYYTLNEWYKNTSDFKKNKKNQIILNNDRILLPNSYLRKMFELNARKHTFCGLILPCVVFLVFALIIKHVQTTYHIRGSFEFLELNETSSIFLDFVMYLFFFLSVGLLYKLVIKRSKIIYSNRGREVGYKHINRKNYDAIMNQLGTTNYIYFEPIETNRLIIRELEEKDISDYYYFASSEIVHKHLLSSPLKSIDEARIIIKNAITQYQEQLIYKLALIRKVDNRLIGYIGLSTYDLTPTTCQIIYAIHEDYWGQGYVSEALEAFIIYLKSIGKTLIIAGHVDENLNSGKVLLKNGFMRDSSRDYQMIIHGELKNILSYIIDERKK